ncbi:MAG TPA: hypothetical protein DCL77_14400 [Prolixibacteraceae bacterium]|nr:hypothetical protein [Prolixibacteraceae bacterium]
MSRSIILTGTRKGSPYRVDRKGKRKGWPEYYLVLGKNVTRQERRKVIREQLKEKTRAPVPPCLKKCE